MSWDVLLMHLPPGARSTRDVPADFRPRSLGTRDEVIERLRTVLPEADFTDPSWGRMEGDDFSIELNIGNDPEVESIMLHIRGTDDALAVLRTVTEALGVRALDLSRGELLDFSADPAEGLRSWRRHRNP